MRLKILPFIVVFITLSSFLVPSVAAQSQGQFFTGIIESIKSEGIEDIGGIAEKFQIVDVKILQGPDTGRTVEIKYGGQSAGLSTNQSLSPQEKVVLVLSEVADTPQYFIADKYRINQVLSLVLFFFTLAIWFGGKKGFRSLIGLIFTIGILVTFVVPKISSGSNPLLISLISTFFIAIISIYLSHGISLRTSIALVGTLITLALSSVLAFFSVALTKLSGLGSEESLFLQTISPAGIDLKGLLLGGIIIGSLGVLDDITTGQSAVVDELNQANHKLSFHDLYHRGLSVGREHIAALINTLALAYAGASLPLLLLFSFGQAQPLWVALNSEFIVEEIVRTIVGSSALILAVPITTLLAAYIYKKT